MEPFPRNVKHCCVSGCEDSISTRHRFPLSEIDVFNVWVKRINHPRFASLQPEGIYKTYVVCGKHFTADCSVSGSKKLKRRVVPTLHLPGYSEVHAVIAKGMSSNDMEVNIPVVPSTSSVEQGASSDHGPSDISCENPESTIIDETAIIDVTSMNMPSTSFGQEIDVPESTNISCNSPEPTVARIERLTGPNGRKKLEPSAVHTADLLLFMDKLFDSVNGNTVNAPPGKKLRKMVNTASDHIEFWYEALRILKSMKYVSSKQKLVSIPSIENWIYTIESFIYVTKKFFKGGINSFSLRRFNQDPIENFFGSIRSHGVRNTNPTT